MSYHSRSHAPIAAVLGLTCAVATQAACSRDANDPAPASAEVRQVEGPCATPLETRERNVPEQQPTRPGQTRACAATTETAFDVTVLTDDLDHP